MSLELLANELLLDLFEYLPAVHLLRVFYDLNTRFNTLLFVHFRAYRFDFRSVSKRDFDSVCQQHLSSIADRILSLRLSDDDETPHQIHCFLSCGLPLRQLTHLQSLSLCHLRSSVEMNKVMIECQHLHHFTHLDFTDCEFRNDYTSIRQLLNNLWSLPKLTHCHLDVSLQNEICILVPSMISTSLEYLSIESYCYGLNDLACLFRNAPCLRHLCVLIRDDSIDPSLSFTVPSLITLKVSVYESPSAMINLLQNVPNLRHLTVQTDIVNMDGHQWEEIIVKSLPKLIVFRLKMIFRLGDDDNKEQRVDELLNSFRTRFWLDERQWFVRCDWDRCQECDKNNIYLYTLPYTFDYYFLHESNFKSKSTCPTDDDYSSYDHVHSLGCEIVSCDNNRVLSHLRFPELHHLYLRLPLDDYILSTISRFDQLTSLQIGPYDGNNDLDMHSHLQAVLDRAPRLYSLKFDPSPLSSTQIPPYRYSNQSVRRLELQDFDRCYDSQQCAMLSRSSLGIPCEVLFIAVENRTNILDLISMMTNLRALNVLCREDSWKEKDNNQSSSSTEDELVEWLQYRLPSTCMITRNDDTIYTHRFGRCRSIRLWIR